MSEQTIINGWNIKNGDYLRDPEYDDMFIKGKKNKIVLQRAVYSIGAVLAVGAFLTVMTFVTNSMKF